MTPTVAVITPAGSANVTNLLPSARAGAPMSWEWYHRCLSAVADVRYVALDTFDSVSGCDTVLVHEALAAVTPGETVQALSDLRARNGQIVWVEPHERTTFSAAVFEPGFFEAVQRVVKFQLMDYPALLAGLRAHDDNLAPWALYGHTSLRGFYGDARFFGLPLADQTITAHLDTDLSALYGDRITPLMRLFTLPRPDSWYDGPPSRQIHILKESGLSLTAGDLPTTGVRMLIAGLLGQSGLDLKVHTSTVRAAATAEACIAMGPTHWGPGAADVLRFPTLAVLPEDPRYHVWDDVFIAGESYLPLRGFDRLLRAGGRIIDGTAAREMATQLVADLGDAELRARILEGQRHAHARLIDPRFVVGKLGISVPPAPAAPSTPRPPRPAIAERAPITVGSIRSDEISVVIQGALGGDDLAEQVVDSVRRELPGAEVIISTWEGQRALDVPVDQRLENADPGAAWQVHEEWPSNTNRLLVSTRAGLLAAQRPYALKLRPDTPLAGTGFLADFQGFPERSPALRLLRDRIVVINYYCWNPDSRPFGLFSVADTVGFGRTGDMRDVWDRPLDPEPENSTWFETHDHPDPAHSLWTKFRYSPEQLLWVGFLRRHLQVPFEHFHDVMPLSRLLAELSVANNVIIVEPERFGVLIPKFASRETLEADALHTHAMWDTLYDRYCVSEPNALIERIEAELALDTAGGERTEAQQRAWRHELDDLADVAFSQLAHPLQDVKGFVVLADAEELICGDDLLATYARTMAGATGATLAIDASRLPAERAQEQLHALVERAELPDGDVDLVAVVGLQDAGARRRMLRRTQALWRRAGADPAADVPVFTPDTASELRRRVEALA